MKKKLSHIFDRAEASELETLIDQNKAPEVSTDTLASIQNKVYEKTGINKVKNKKPLMLRWQSLAATAACLCLIFGLTFGAYAMKETYEKTNGWSDQTDWIGINNVIDPTTEEPFSWNIDLNKSHDELLKDLEGTDIVIQKDDVMIQGRALWDDFYQKTQNGQSSKIKIVYLSTSQETQEVFLRELSFDGEMYKQDTMPALNPECRDIRIYTHLCKFEGEYKDSIDESQSYEYEDYVLTIYPILAVYYPNKSYVISAWSGCKDFSVVCKFRTYI
jgi:hypothetical protein